MAEKSTTEKKIRKSILAGSWYPKDKDQLKKQILSYLSEQSDFEQDSVAEPDSVKGNIIGLIVPHAGHIFSGRVAGKAYSLLKEQDIKRVIILAPSHYFFFIGAALCDYTHYETPLGDVKVANASSLLGINAGNKNPSNPFILYQEAHSFEHAIEIQLPFLQLILNDFEMLPIIIGADTSQNQIKEIAASLIDFVPEKTLVIASSDFTHYGPNYDYLPFVSNVKENLKKLDMKAANLIIQKDSEVFLRFIEETGSTICGNLPIAILIEIMQHHGAEAKLIAYDTSGNITGDFTNSVSYCSIAFFKQGKEERIIKNKKVEEKW